MRRLHALAGLLVVCLLSSLLVAASVVGASRFVAAKADAVAGLGDGLGPVPDLAAASRQFSQPSVVLAGDGAVLGRFVPEELHDPLAPDEIPETVAAAVVAAEDERFWLHPGVDVVALGRALLRNLRAGGVVQGGSTISQQLVKNVFTEGDRTLDRKLEELRIALQLERHHDKREILAAYLNTTYFGDGAIGIEAAARSFLRKPATELSLGEAALLAGLIPSPTDYNPRRNPGLAEDRRQSVLDRVAEAGTVAAEEIEAARAEVPAVHPRLPSVESHPYFLDYVRRWLIEVAGVSLAELRSGGLTIETTLDPALQAHALETVRAHLPHPADPAAAVAVVDPHSGEVRALVGGRDWQGEQVNLALGRLGGGTGRQPGSAFKAVVLALAYESGASPYDWLPAPAEYELEGGHIVHNYSRRGYGSMSIADATRWSINTAFTDLAISLGLDRVADLARRLGLSQIPPGSAVGPSLAIGAYEVSPLNMAAAYGAFAADGRPPFVHPVRRVLGPDGSVLHDWTAPEPAEPVIHPATARQVTSTLQGVIRSGTGTAAAFGRPAAGKTGTSSNYADAWFVGYTPQLAAAVWVGFADGIRPMHGIAGFSDVTGGSIPARIWRDVMRAAHAGLPVAGFGDP
jgi:penicillin-binding protein 1A